MPSEAPETQGTLPLKGDTSKGQDDVLAKQVEEQGKLIAELKADRDAKAAKAAKLEADHKAREEDSRRKDTDSDTLRKELLERDKRIEALASTIRQRVDLLMSKIPETAQKKYALIKDDIDPTKMIALLEAEIETAPAPTGDKVTEKKLPPPTGSPITDARKAGDHYTPTAGAIEFLSTLMRDDKLFDGRQAIRRQNEGQSSPRRTHDI
jgi:hypothetical protein